MQKLKDKYIDITHVLNELYILLSCGNLDMQTYMELNDFYYDLLDKKCYLRMFISDDEVISINKILFSTI